MICAFDGGRCLMRVCLRRGQCDYLRMLKSALSQDFQPKRLKKRESFLKALARLLWRSHVKL